MAEKKTLIPQKEFRSGYYIELECAMCQNKETFGADTKKELHDLLSEETESGTKWRNINSDMYGLIGWHCGCDYKD